MQSAFSSTNTQTTRPVIIHWDSRNLPETSGNLHALQGLAKRVRDLLAYQYGIPSEVHRVNTKETGRDFKTDILVGPVAVDLDHEPYFIRGWNLSNFGVLHGEGNLVAHHLTRDTLKKASEAFNARFRKNAERIVMVNFASGCDEALCLIDFDKTLSRLSRQLGKFTVFLCGSRHASTGLVQHAGDRIKLVAERQGLRIPVFYYDHVERFDGQLDNPYKGLLSKAAVVMIVGDSKSVLSEAVYAGKKPLVAHKHFTNSDPYFTAIGSYQYGMPVSFTCPSRNVTDDIAAFHVRGFLAHAAATGLIDMVGGMEGCGVTSDLPLRLRTR